MNSHLEDLEQIRDRLLELERQNRRFKQLGATALIVAASLLLMGQASTKKTVEANEFLLKDTSGKVRGVLSVRELMGKDDSGYSTAQLVLYDNDGRERARIESGLPTLGLGPAASKLSDLIGGGSLTLADADGRERVDLSADKSSGGTLSLKDEKCVPGTVLRANNATLRSVDKGGPVAVLTDAGLSVTDEQGFGVTVGATELTTAQTGETRKRSAASIVLVDRNKNVFWKVP